MVSIELIFESARRIGRGLLYDRRYPFRHSERVSHLNIAFFLFHSILRWHLFGYPLTKCGNSELIVFVLLQTLPFQTSHVCLLHSIEPENGIYQRSAGRFPGRPGVADLILLRCVADVEEKAPGGLYNIGISNHAEYLEHSWIVCSPASASRTGSFGAAIDEIENLLYVSTVFCVVAA